jgi:hypothetical protein
MVIDAEHSRNGLIPTTIIGKGLKPLDAPSNQIKLIVQTKNVFWFNCNFSILFFIILKNKNLIVLF